MEKIHKKQSVIRSAAAMSLGTMSSRVLGMARDMVLAAFFSNMTRDAFVVAYKLPNLFRRLLGEGSLAVSFIPVFIEQLYSETNEKGEVNEIVGKERAMRLASAIFTLLLMVAATFSALGFVFMEQLLLALVSGQGFMSVEGKFEMTLILARIMFSYLFLVTTYAYLSGLLNALKSFFIPAFAPALFNVVFILFALIPKHWADVPGEFLAWGVIVGGIIQVITVAIALIRRGYLPRLRIRFCTPGVAVVLKNMIPGVIGMGVLQLMGLANVNFASRLPEGSHSYIYLADRILELPQSLIAISIGTALLPTLAELWGSGRQGQMRLEAQRHMRLLMSLALPAAVGMFVLALPIVEALYMRLNFTQQDAINTASVVKVYSFLLVVSSLNKVTVPSFYAIKNTWLPAIVSIVSLCVHLVLANYLVDVYGLVGLIASTTFAGGLNLFLLLIFYRTLIGGLGGSQFLKSVIKMLPAVAVMGVCVHYFYQLLDHFWLRMIMDGGHWIQLSRGLAILITVSIGILIYFIFSKLLGNEEGVHVMNMFMRRIPKTKKL